MLFLHALRCEVREADGFLAKHAFYAHLEAYYDKRCPLYGHLSSILSFRTNASLEYISAAVEADPLFPMFDGAISQCSSLESPCRARQGCIAVSHAIGVGVTVKQWGVLGGVCGDGALRKWKNTISPDAATRMGPLSKAPWVGMRLYNSIIYIRAPDAYDLPPTDGPFNVDQYNCNVG